MEQSELFAQVNDSIRELAGERREAEIWEFVCECPDVTCHAMVSLTLTEFDEHRASPSESILAREHSEEIKRSQRLREDAEVLRRQARHQVARAKNLRNSLDQGLPRVDD